VRFYIDSEARRKLAEVLTRANEEGKVRIRRRDGTEYVLRFRSSRGSPLDMRSMDTYVSAKETVTAVRESPQPSRR
jgi:hypothetical protein